jgi:hypothetical protein
MVDKDFLTMKIDKLLKTDQELADMKAAVTKNIEYLKDNHIQMAFGSNEPPYG